MIKKFNDFDGKFENERESFERELNARKKTKQEKMFDDIPFGEIEIEIKDEISKDENYHLSIGRKKIEVDNYKYSYNYIQYDSENLGRLFVYNPDDNSKIGYFEFNGRTYTEDADTIRNFYHYLKQLIKNDPVKDNTDLIIDFDMYESLRNKMKGKSDDVVDKKVDEIIKNVVWYISDVDGLPDSWKTYDFIKNNYTGWILDAIDEGHPPSMYTEVLIDFIEEEYYSSKEYLSTLEKKK